MEKLERDNSKITLYITLKSATAKKLRLQIWAIRWANICRYYCVMG